MALAYVCLYLSYRESLEPYTMEERGRLVTAMMNYQATGEIPAFSGNERFLWPTLRSQLDRDIQGYEEKCAKNRENGCLLVRLSIWRFPLFFFLVFTIYQLEKSVKKNWLFLLAYVTMST